MKEEIEVIFGMLWKKSNKCSSEDPSPEVHLSAIEINNARMVR